MTDAVNAALARCEALAEPQGLAVSYRYRGIFKDFGASYECREFTFCPCEFTAPTLIEALGLVEARLAVRAERPEKGAAR